MLGSLVLSQAWAKERPNATSARGGIRVHKDLRRRLPVAFVAEVAEAPISLLAVPTAEAVEQPIITNWRMMTDHFSNIQFHPED